MTQLVDAPRDVAEDPAPPRAGRSRALLGLVPFVGDLLDVAHRANRKNLHLLLREVEREPLREPPTPAYVAGAVVLTTIPIIAGLAIAVLSIVLLVRWIA